MNEIIDLLESLMRQAAELSDELSEEEMAEVINVFKNAIELIMNSEKGTEGLEPSAPEVPAGNYPSSNVNGFKFDPKTGELLVQFHGKYPQAEGPVYSYGGVPPYLYDIIAKGAIGPKTSGKNKYHEWIKGVTPSLGGTVNAILKAGGFPYKKVA